MVLNSMSSGFPHAVGPGIVPGNSDLNFIIMVIIIVYLFNRLGLGWGIFFF